MGAFPSAAGRLFVPPAVGDIPTAFLADLGAKEGATIIQKRQLVFKAYIEACSAFAGVVHDYKRNPEKFAKSIANVVPSLFRLFQRKGQRRFVLNSIFYYVLLGPEVKLFQSHMRGLEAVSFLAIPGVSTPHSAICHYMGVSIACIELSHLHNAAPPSSCHVSVVKSVISAALRLRHDPPVVLYCGGNGMLVVVDATSLLPQLCAPGASGKYWHCARPELLLARDLSGFVTQNLTSGVLFPARDPNADDNITEKSVLSAVLDAAASKKKHTGTPVLNILAALVAPNTTVLSDKMTSVSAPAASTDASHYEYRHAHGFKANLQLTTTILHHVVPIVALELESLPETATPAELVAQIKNGGLGIHCLGHLWHCVDTGSFAHKLIGIEIIARAAKRWHQFHVFNDSTVCEAQAMALFRGFNDDAFVSRELVPFETSMFGQLVPPPTPRGLPFRVLFDRVQQQLGVQIVSGQLQSIFPRVRVARRRFALLAPQEAAVCQVAVRRDDGIAASAIVSAAARWGDSIVRQARLVEQVDARVRPPSENLLGHLFLIHLKISLFRTFVEKGRPAEAADVLSEAIMGFYTYSTECAHDKLFAISAAIPLVDCLSQNGKVNVALEHVRQMLALGGLSDFSNISVVAGRTLLEDLHRVSIETCFATRQLDEAGIIAQRWHRICPLLFGAVSTAYCRATKTLLSCSVKLKQRVEAVRLARQLIDLTAATMGPDSVAMAHAISDYASITWRRNPEEGMRLYQRAHDLYLKLLGPASRGVCTSVYNIGLALARMNKLCAALAQFQRARGLATQLNEASTAAMCLRSEQTIISVAVVKIQRWYREQKYGQAKSQTTKTDVTTLCSTLSWSDDHDEISSAGGME